MLTHQNNASGAHGARKPPPRLYIGRCKTKGCKHATRSDWTSIQDLDSNRWARSATTGDKILIGRDGRTYDNARPFILNGVAVSAKCPDHGVYRLGLLNGKHSDSRECDARCLNATGPNCECQCGGLNHGANHA